MPHPDPQARCYALLQSLADLPFILDTQDALGLLLAHRREAQALLPLVAPPAEPLHA